MGDGHPTGPLDGLQAYSGPSQKRGGVLFLKASTNYVLGDDREHLLLSTVIIIIILLFLLNLPLLMSRGQN